MKAASLSNPRLLRLLLFRQVLRRFAGGEAFLVGIMVLADLFSTMWRLLAMDANAASILLWLLAGIPAHASEVLPIAFLFGVTLSLAEMHADGELLVIFGSGISIRSLSRYIVVLSILMAGLMFAANDWVTIPASLKRDSLYRSMTGQKGQGSQVSEITIMADGGRFVYKVGYYDPTAIRLVDVDIIERNDSGQPLHRIMASRAEWKTDRWSFSEARIFSKKDSGEWTEKTESNFTRADLNESPESFGILREKPSLKSSRGLYDYIRLLKGSGLPSVEAETELHKRFSLLFTPLIVCGLSIAFAGLFRKNSLLMSLLFSLSTATVYYVAQMLGSLAAKTGWLSPAFGIWSVTIVFLAVASLGYMKART
ncbi:MAG: LptF/LptG family permease [Rectinemataceae bacterium]|nr:LptF/LptG family permease [Rectinemataceae bacterium]